MRDVSCAPVEALQHYSVGRALDVLIEQKAGLRREILFRVSDLFSAEADLVGNTAASARLSS